MFIRRLLYSPRARRGLAAGAIALSLGGLVLYRAQAARTPDVMVPEVEAGKISATFSGPGARGAWSLSHGKVLARRRQQLFAELRIASTVDQDGPRERAPLALALVLDTSGSMQGDKIEEAKRSVLELIERMRDSDQIALVRYASRAELVQPLARLGHVRHSLANSVRNMEASGGTNIPLGLRHGLDALDDADSGRVQRLVLVSDGLDSTREVAVSLAQGSAGDGTTISSLGIGLDFDESYLSAVARAGRGNFGFVKNASTLARFLRRELDETAQTTIRNAYASLRLPRNVDFVQVVGAEAHFDEQDRVLELELGSLFAGDERRVVVELSTDLDADQSIGLEGRVAWTPIDGAEHEARLKRLAVVASSDRSDVRRSRDHRVYARCLSAMASLRGLEASEAYARGDGARAQTLLRDNLADLREAARHAPEEEAARLQSQIASYEKTKGDFATAAPSSAAGREAAKASAADESSNLARETY